MPQLEQPLGSGRISEVFAWGEGRVLKLQCKEYPRDWVDYEAQVTSAAHAAGAPAPAVLGTAEIDGRCGIIFERLDGPSMLSQMAAAPLRIGQLGRLLAKLHAGMHAQTPAGLPDQHERLARSIRAAQALTDAQRDAALRALDQRPRGAALCHMDFHPDNVILTASGPRVIDWMTACAGNPWADLARTTLMLTVGGPPPGFRFPQLLLLAKRWFRANYLRRYLALRPDPTGELRAWLPILAAARLNENIPGESKALLAMLLRAFGV